MTSSKQETLAGLVVLTRHGQTDFNAQRRFQGQLDVQLNSKGREQAARAGEFISGLCRIEGRGLRPNRLDTSDLSRALETASIINAAISANIGAQSAPRLVVSSDYREFHVGRFAGKTFAEIEKDEPNLASTYLEAYDGDPIGTAYPEGESQQDVKNRILRSFRPFDRDVLSPEMHWADGLVNRRWQGRPFDLIVSHGGALSTLLAALNIPLDKKLGNCDCVIIGRYEDSYRLLSHVQLT